MTDASVMGDNVEQERARCDVAARLASVRERIAGACRMRARDPQSVRLVAVTKTVPSDLILEAVRCGQLLFGENYVQEGARKREVIEKSGLAAAGQVHWHLIGNLQRNKVARAVEAFDMIQSVDRAEVADAISSRSAAIGKRMPVLMQINISGEGSKSGIDPEHALGLAERLAVQEGIELRGLMCIGRIDEGGVPDDVRRQEFGAMRSIRDDLAARLGIELPELSMGMSDDYVTAVEEGATIVRVGSAIFGART